jgi:hypothetical protein
MMCFISDANATNVKDDFNRHVYTTTYRCKGRLSVYIFNVYPYMFDMSFFDRQIIYMCKLMFAMYCR